jgi:hypothetical protein
VPVYLVTGHIDPDIRERADLLGASGLMQKPIKLLELSQTLDALAAATTQSPRC